MFILNVLFSGIAGIEKKMQQKNATDNKNISKAFQDLDRLGQQFLFLPTVSMLKHIALVRLT